MSNFARYPSLHNRHVLVTGGASGIGRSIVEHFLDQGSRVSFLDIDEKAASTLDHPQAYFLRCDLQDIDHLRESIQEAQAHFGPISVLVNNAALDIRHDFKTLTPQDWDRLQNINVRPHLFTAQAVYEDMKSLGGGSMIHLSSNSYLLRVGGMPAYLSAKAGIVGLSRALARELGPDRIRVNTVLPGWIMTDRQLSLWLTEEAEKELLDTQCLKEKLYPEDIARFVLYLAADDSKMISGQEFILDGGRA
jgi:NAD(P)-dependent dehydrogenase (short-subunit alcohol dehydrogenase family)